MSKELSNAKTRPKQIDPPWVVFPEYSPFCMGWRMGAGEDFMDEWKLNIGQLSNSERREYFRDIFPPPGEWVGFLHEQGFHNERL